MPQTKIAMRFSARAFIVVLCLSVLTSIFGTSRAFAQTTMPATSSYTDATTVNSYTPNVDPNVPLNQHTRIQTLMIDVLASTVCILVGVDPADPSKPCLDVNPQTGKIGYNPASFDENGQPKVGGILGASTHMISALYTPTISGKQYSDYLAQNFGIVKPAYAQEVGYGFTGLNAIMTLWIAMRNMAYFILMVAFVLIGLGIMLRIEMPPRTIMTIQNQIPRIVICIILITFSFPIAGVAIDTMWLMTYVGINVITASGGSVTNPIVPGDRNLANTDPNYPNRPLSEVASANLLQMPISYVNNVFRVAENQDFMNGSTQDIDTGVKNITQEVSYSIGQFLEQLIRQMIGVNGNDSCSFGFSFSLRACLTNVLGFVAKILLWLIILITVLKTLFSVWFTLLKAYTFIIVYSIAGPLFIVMGLLPGKPLGFEKWLRSLTANLGVFPVTAWVFVLARLFVDLYRNQGGEATAAISDRFIPPLVGNPAITGLMGWLIAFGLLLMTPTLLTILQESLKVTGTKHGAAIGAGLAAGAAMPKAVGGAAWKKSWQKGNEHQDAGWMRRIAAGKGAPQGAPDFSWKSPSTYRAGWQRFRYKLNKYDRGKSNR